MGERGSEGPKSLGCVCVCVCVDVEANVLIPLQGVRIPSKGESLHRERRRACGGRATPDPYLLTLWWVMLTYLDLSRWDVLSVQCYCSIMRGRDFHLAATSSTVGAWRPVQS